MAPERVKTPVPLNTKEPLPAMNAARVEEPPWLMISEAEAELPMVMVTPLAAITPPPEPAIKVRLFELLQLKLLAMVILPTPEPAIPELVVNTLTLLLASASCKVVTLIMDVAAPLSGV